MSFHFNAKLSEAEHVSNSLVPFYMSVSTFKYFFGGLYAWITHQLVQGDGIYKSYKTSLLLACYQFIRNYSRPLTCIQLRFYSVNCAYPWVGEKEIGEMSDKHCCPSDPSATEKALGLPPEGGREVTSLCGWYKKKMGCCVSLYFSFFRKWRNIMEKIKCST